MAHFISIAIDFKHKSHNIVCFFLRLCALCRIQCEIYVSQTVETQDEKKKNHKQNIREMKATTTTTYQAISLYQMCIIQTVAMRHETGYKCIISTRYNTKGALQIEHIFVSSVFEKVIPISTDFYQKKTHFARK